LNAINAARKRAHEFDVQIANSALTIQTVMVELVLRYFAAQRQGLGCADGTPTWRCTDPLEHDRSPRMSFKTRSNQPVAIALRQLCSAWTTRRQSHRYLELAGFDKAYGCDADLRSTTTVAVVDPTLALVGPAAPARSLPIAMGPTPTNYRA
jgi:hypothetical protein